MGRILPLSGRAGRNLNGFHRPGKTGSGPAGKLIAFPLRIFQDNGIFCRIAFRILSRFFHSVHFIGDGIGHCFPACIKDQFFADRLCCRIKRFFSSPVFIPAGKLIMVSHRIFRKLCQKSALLHNGICITSFLRIFRRIVPFKGHRDQFDPACVKDQSAGQRQIFRICRLAFCFRICIPAGKFITGVIRNQDIQDFFSHPSGGICEAVVFFPISFEYLSGLFAIQIECLPLHCSEIDCHITGPVRIEDLIRHQISAENKGVSRTILFFFPAAESQTVNKRCRWFFCFSVFPHAYRFIGSIGAVIIQERQCPILIRTEPKLQIIRRHGKDYGVVFFCPELDIRIFALHFHTGVAFLQCDLQADFRSRPDACFCHDGSVLKVHGTDAFSKLYLQLRIPEGDLIADVRFLFPAGEEKACFYRFCPVHRHEERLLFSVKSRSLCRKLPASVFLRYKIQSRFTLRRVNGKCIFRIRQRIGQLHMIIDAAVTFKPAYIEIISYLILFCFLEYVETYHSIVRCHIAEVTDPGNTVLHGTAS